VHAAGAVSAALLRFMCLQGLRQHVAAMEHAGEQLDILQQENEQLRMELDLRSRQHMDIDPLQVRPVSSESPWHIARLCTPELC